MSRTDVREDGLNIILKKLSIKKQGWKHQYMKKGKSITTDGQTKVDKHGVSTLWIFMDK